MYEEVKRRRMRVALSTSDVKKAKELFDMVVSELFWNASRITFSKKTEKVFIEFEVQIDEKAEILRKIALKANECDISDFAMTEETVVKQEQEDIDPPNGEIKLTEKMKITTGDNILEETSAVTKTKGKDLIPKDLISEAQKLSSLEQLVELVSSYCGYPKELSDELTSVFRRAKDILEKGGKVTWENLMDDIPNPLAYRKKFVTPIKQKFGDGLRFPVFVREMIDCISNRSDSPTDEVENIPFEQVIRDNLYVDNFEILGRKAEPFLKILQEVHLQENELREKVTSLYTCIYEIATESTFNLDKDNSLSIDFISFVLQQDQIMPNGVTGEEFNHYKVGDLTGTDREMEIMRIFLKTGSIVNQFMQKCFNKEMNLKDFLITIKPAIVI